jgi:pimeloyl-ACP methyl ester carboxylesterase
LRPCAGDEGPSEAYCGTYTVFEDRRARAGRRIALKIIVLRSLSDDDRPDPLVFLAGGPGQAAAQMADDVRTAFKRVQRHRDVVLVDQRGTGQSHPLNCPSETDTLRSAFASEEDSLALLRKCLGKLNADVRLYTTSIAMDDLDDVRQHLGYEKINIYGGSYGTRAALVYLRQHEAHVRSLVLDGVAPTSMRLPLFAARDAGLALGKLLSDCEAEPACRTAYPKLTSRVRALLARLEAAPARVRLVHPRTGEVDTVNVTARSVANILFGALYSPKTAAILPLLIDRAAKDDFQGLLALAIAGDTSENMSVGMQLSVLCSEDTTQITDADIARETAGTMFGPHLAASQMEACDAWPKGLVAPNYSAHVVSDVPALVLSGDIDPVTPPSWGEAVVRHLKRGRHWVAAATGHGVASTPCGARLIADFLEAGTADGLDARCLADAKRPPFFLTQAGPDPTPTPGPGR